MKLFGADLTVLEGKAREIANVVRTVKGASDVYPEQVTGGLYLDIRPNREAAARYGIDVGGIQDVIETAIGENNITTTIEGRRRSPSCACVMRRNTGATRRKFLTCLSPEPLARKSRWGRLPTSVRCPGRQ